MDHSYYNDTSIILYRAAPEPGRFSVLYSVFGERFENMVKLDWPNPLDYINFYLYGSVSVNGILCMEGVTTGTMDKKLVFWNPATREFKVTPPSPFALETPYWHPLIDFYGFGYDQVRDDYKVIRRITFFEDPWERSDDELLDDFWEIYCLKSNKWRKLNLNMPQQFRSNVGGQVYAGGVCHWWGSRWWGNRDSRWWGNRDPGSEINDDNDYLVSFDFNNETFVKTSIPSKMDFIDSTTDVVNRHLNLLNGSIVLISNYRDTDTFHISILGEVGIKESWIKLCIVGPLLGVKYPIGIGKKGNIFIRKKDDEVVWFNLNTQKMEELGITGGNSSRIMIYKENFLPFERIND